MEFNLARDFTYPLAFAPSCAKTLKSFMIGEIRDPEIAAIAVQAVLTGHLVISTIHSGSTAGVFTRMINMGIESFLLASSILGLRLVRKNCPLCATLYPPDPAMLKRVSKTLLEDASWRRSGGCGTCNETCFAGRTALTEMLAVNEPIRNAVMGKLRTRKLQAIAQEQGMKTI